MAGKIATEWLESLGGARSSSAATRPRVTVAFAMSEDACLAEAVGGRTAISSDASLRFTHALRAAHDAVLVGIGTVLTDDPLLTTRLAPGPTGLRVVLDTRFRTPASARILRADARPPVVVGSTHSDRESDARRDTIQRSGARAVSLPSDPRGVALGPLLAWLHGEGVRSLMVEGGRHVLESFFAENLVDDLSVTVSPKRLRGGSPVTVPASVERALGPWMGGRGEPLGPDRLYVGRFGPPPAGRS